MKENNKRSIVLVIIAIATLILIVGGATYAFFATGRDLENGIVNANVGTAASMYSFSATSNGNIEMNIAFNEMSEANVSTNVLKTDNATIDVSLASPSEGMKTTCTYDIVWVWDSDDKYTIPDVKLPYMDLDEQTILDLFGITKEEYEEEKRLIEEEYGPGAFESMLAEELSSMGYEGYPYEFSTRVDGNDEKDLSKLSIRGNKIILQEEVSIESSGTISTTKTHTIEANIYNLPVDQRNLFGKSFKAHITIENLDCNMESYELPYHQTCNDDFAACTIAKLYASEENQLNINNGAAGLYYHDEDLANGAKDNIYRYTGRYSYPKASKGYNSYDSIMVEGSVSISNCGGSCYTLGYDETNTNYSKDNAINKAIADGYLEEAVNNYVCFAGDDCTNEDNLYRIISIDGTAGQIKLIKYANIDINESLKWNSKAGYKATGTKYDTVMGLTNGTTYTNIWAIKQTENTYYTSSLNDYLNGEYLTSLGDKANLIEQTPWSVGGVNVLSLTPKAFMDIELNNNTIYTAKIGLMYVSEYGFAALPQYWTKNLFDYSLSKDNNWMLTTIYPWTISRNSNGSSSAFDINHNGNLNDYYVSYPTPVVRPSFSLKSNVKITNINVEGVGSKDNPMIIA